MHCTMYHLMYQSPDIDHAHSTSGALYHCLIERCTLCIERCTAHCAQVWKLNRRPTLSSPWPPHALHMPIAHMPLLTTTCELVALSTPPRCWLTCLCSSLPRLRQSLNIHGWTIPHCCTMYSCRVAHRLEAGKAADRNSCNS